MTNFVDCMLAPIKTSSKSAYVDKARQEAEIFKRHGALQVVECWGADVPDGELTSMPMAIKLEADETVLLSWILWPSREARDKGMEAAMQEGEMSGSEMMFDGRRMIFGGFDMLLES